MSKQGCFRRVLFVFKRSVYNSYCLRFTVKDIVKYVTMRGHGETIFSPGDLGARLRARCGEGNNKTRKLLFGVQHVGKKSKSNG